MNDFKNFLVLVLLSLIIAVGTLVKAQGIFLSSPIVWHPTDDIVAISNPDGSIDIRDANDFQVLHTLIGHTDKVNDLAWSHDGTLLASGGFDNSVNIWEVNSGNLLYTLSYEQSLYETVSALTWSPDNSQIIVGRPGDIVTRLTIWDVTTQNIVEELPAQYVLSMSWSGDKQALALGTVGGIIVVDWNTKKIINQLHIGQLSDPSQVFAVAWHPDNTYIASGSLGGTIRVWDLESSQIISEYRGTDTVYDGINVELLTTQIRALSFNEEGTQLLSLSGDGVFKTWDWISSIEVNHLNVGTPIYGASFNSNGSKLIYLDDTQVSSVSGNQPKSRYSFSYR